MNEKKPMDQELHEVHLHALAGGGEAVGRLEDGRVVFVPLGAANEDVMLHLSQSSARMGRGEIVEVRSAASTRIVAPCPYYPQIGERDAGCGGCQLQHIEAAAQLGAKRGFLVGALQRIGRFGAEIEEVVAPCVPSPDAFFYRNKAEFSVASTCGPLIGFRARNSHQTIDIARCLISDELINRVLAAARAAIFEGLAPPQLLQRLIVRVAQGEALVVVETTEGAWPREREFAAQLRSNVPQVVGVMRREEKKPARLLEDGADSRDWLEENMEGIRLRVTADGFFQVNASAAALLVQHAMRFAEVEHGTRVLDVYCGVGLFALAMARGGAQVTGIESGHQAVRDARRNAKLNNLDAEFFADDAARALKKLVASTRSSANDGAPRFETIVLDPPRAGAADCIAPILQLRPGRLIYVSCDAATFARDAQALASGGYTLREAVPVDMFPQTAHVECVALFTLEEI